MFSTIKDICKFTFSIAKNTAEISGELLHTFAETVDKLACLSKRSTELEEKIKELHLALSTIPDELMMSFGGIELLKTKIIKFINNNIEIINGKFNIEMDFIESLSLENFTRTIHNINTDDLSINEIEELFDELDSIELVSKTNKGIIKLLLCFTRTTELSIDIKSNPHKNIIKLIELLSKDDVFNKILSQ